MIKKGDTSPNKGKNNRINMELFCKRLKNRYKELHLTRQTLSDKAGIGKSTIDSWFPIKDYDKEKNELQVYPITPTLDKVLKVAKALDCSVDFLTRDDVECTTVSNELIHKEIGLSDEAIDGIKKLRANNSDEADMLNLLLSHPSNMANILIAARQAIYNDYHIPVVYSETKGGVSYAIVGNTLTDVIHHKNGKETRFLNLAKHEDTADQYSIAVEIDNSFCESVAANRFLNSLRDLKYQLSKPKRAKKEPPRR